MLCYNKIWFGWYGYAAHGISLHGPPKPYYMGVREMKKYQVSVVQVTSNEA